MAGAPQPPPFNPDVRFLGFMTVVPMVIGSALFMLIGSLLSAPPSQKTIDRYFPSARAETEPAAAGAGIS